MPTSSIGACRAAVDFVFFTNCIAFIACDSSIGKTTIGCITHIARRELYEENMDTDISNRMPAARGVFREPGGINGNGRFTDRHNHAGSINGNCINGRCINGRCDNGTGGSCPSDRR